MSDAELSKIRLFELNILQQKLNLAIKEKKISIIFAPVFIIVLGIWCIMTIYLAPKDFKDNEDSKAHLLAFYAYIILIIVFFVLPTAFLITSVVNSDADIMEYKQKIAQKEKTLN